MLSEDVLILLTGFVDGVLSREERDAVERLLRESSEARAWLRQLQDNMHRLKKLPKRSLGAEFATDMVGRLADVPVERAPVLVTKPKLRRGLPAWMVGAVAASVATILVGGVLWLLRENVDVNRDLLPHAQKQQPRPEPRVVPEEKPSPAEQLVTAIVKGSSGSYVENKADVVTLSRPGAPVRYTFADLKQPNRFDSMKWEFTGKDAVHIDVSVKYNPRSLNRLLEAFHKNGIVLTLTPPAQASVQQKQPVLVFAENVRADALAQALRELGEADTQSNTRQPSTYESLSIGTAVDEDRQRTAASLGLPTLQTRPAVPGATVPGRGVVVAPQAGSASAAEVREFLAARQGVQPGTLQVFVNLVPK